MKFAIGYWVAAEGRPPITEVCQRFSGHIEEVYFPWPYAPSGRSPLGIGPGGVNPGAHLQLMEELTGLKRLNVKLDLLLNANCYGRRGLSIALANEVCSIVAFLADLVGLDAVTTASPMIARVIKLHFPSVEVRASVNMKIGTIRAMQYLAHLFDGFYVQRENNRNLGRLEELSEWASRKGKKLFMLANSGCLDFCPSQTFHDNLVAHESEIAEMRNLEGFNPAMCWDYLARPKNWPALLQSSWVRPEDIHRYPPYFHAAKLATRMHANPHVVVQAYCEGRYTGNLLDLLEPGHGPLLAPYIIDNTRFPSDWHETVTRCDKRCHGCHYCARVLEDVLLAAAPL